MTQRSMSGRVRRGRLWLAAFGIVVPVVLTGCAGTQLTQSADLEVTRKRQDELLNEIRKLRELNQTETERRSRADVEVQEALAEVNARFERLEFQIRDLLDGLARVQGGGGVTPPTDANPGGEASGPPPTSTGSTASGGADPPTAPAQTDPRAEYDTAYLEVTRGNFDDAIAAFDAFLARHPATDLADNAMYWIGECHYASERYDESIDAFVRLMDSYPEGDKVPAAMLKLGYAFKARGDADAARRYLEALVDQYPASDEAGLAKRRLAEL